MCAAALEEYCGSVFWNASYVQREDPDLPVCIQQTVLIWIPLGFLWLGAPWLLGSLCTGKRFNRKHLSKLYLCKQLVVSLLLVTAIAALAVTLGEDYGPNKDSSSTVKNAGVFYVNPVLYAVTWILLLLCQEGVRRMKEAVDSTILFLFWLLLVVCNIVPFQSLIREAFKQGEISDVPHFCIFYISFGLEVIALVLSAVADIAPEAEELVKKNPEAGAAFLSRITFNWINSMVIKGYKQPLVQEDMWELNKADRTASIDQVFQSFMQSDLAAARVRLQTELRKKREKKRAQEDTLENGLCNGLREGVSQDVLMMEKKGRKEGKNKTKEEKEDYPNSWLFSTIYKTLKKDFTKSALLKVLQDILIFVSPQILKLMISFTQDKSRPDWEGYMYAVLLLLVAILQSLLLQQYFHLCFVLGVQVRTAIMTAVYKKALVMSNDNRKESSVGETVNLMSADAQRFNDLTSFIHLLWSCPLQIILSIAFLWMELGPSALAGLAAMVILVPLNALLATKARSLGIENMKFKDQRLKIMNEILNGIKILKLYAWEPSFQTQIGSVRDKELELMKKSAYLTCVSYLLFTFAPVLVSIVSFAVFVGVSSENILTPEIAFTSISIFNLIRFPLSMLPILVALLVQTVVSKDRLEKFLGSEELESDSVQHDPSFDSAVSVCDGSFAWDRNAEPLLKNVSLDIKPGRLVAVVGAVGSGKSSLMSALLGEMHRTKGFINIQGSLAFVPQQAWIQNATLRDNILFGSPHEDKKLQEVIEACALIPDLELLPGGDLTEIGEKGVNLSGGQKQRISLARAAYNQADIYLLDDPLSAVDSHVGKHLFDKVIGPKGLLKDKTRILVTHGLSFLPYADEIVVLLDGEVSEVGSYQSLRASRGAFSEFLDTYAGEQRKSTLSDSDSCEDTADVYLVSESEDAHADSALEDVVSVVLKRENSIRRSLSRGSVRLRRKSSCVKKPEAVDQTKDGQRLIEKETMETGRVKFSVYLKYLRAMGWSYFVLASMSLISSTAASVGQSVWLSDWTNDAVVYYNMTYPPGKVNTRVAVYGVLGLSQGIFVFIASLLLAKGAVAASTSLHSRLLHSILRAPMLFFDTTPIGRVVNRFAKDIYTIDEAIPQSFRSWLVCLLSVLGILFVISFATPVFVIVIIPLAVLYYFVQVFYIGMSRQLRRLDSVTRSPIFSHFGETVSGLSVIRAYGHQERFLKHNEIVMDENLKSIYPWIVSNRWLAIRLEFLGNLVVFFAALFAVIARETMDSGLVGLSISNALSITQVLNWLVRMNSELETNVVAVERVDEYTGIEKEAEWINDNRPPDKWPEEGRLEFEDYKVRYRPGLDLVLHGITCNIKSTEKIGIVGRTGAGKSSLTNCLFRIIESAAGRILIDGIDISTIGLHDLRRRLTIIPQDPVLFSGTLRMNLDPFDTFSDEDIWRALELSHLTDFVAGLQEKLQYAVTEGGENLSVGQRQLLCLARALLRKSRILFLDEATAAVDLETDSLIQNTIRKEFSHCTVLTIAHRLHSILDCSRVMVLDAGKIVEFDSPSNLFEKRGQFYAMAKDAGITGEEITAL
ncbi:putative canalicular multispecific organic anion transporter 1 isoform 3 [Scophthalmus maximus]|uniref:Putative canalicular multispecific organic anion transporter 1 n=1 Tax=Scophthalmus maximus TaxID=52904 RepID=A0A2U9CD77_SCOMX|nr:putative canalicular multispecific organic anion transporter 1 [Scophthalmus maximus]AWP14019.1 putative canalicular multispecific organic anion transporter 1 isoform 2 [Scophthalmus maximus]AWP14020.1 putative canalicular multispecific organic anion transporter 1 isoform 3 [Scophthalmus maximus]